VSDRVEVEVYREDCNGGWEGSFALVVGPVSGGQPTRDGPRSNRLSRSPLSAAAAFAPPAAAITIWWEVADVAGGVDTRHYPAGPRFKWRLLHTGSVSPEGLFGASSSPTRWCRQL
jgi:hypothetical protein